MILKGISAMNSTIEYQLGTLGDENVCEEFSQFSKNGDGTAKLSLDHYMVSNIDHWVKQSQKQVVDKDGAQNT